MAQTQSPSVPMSRPTSPSSSSSSSASGSWGSRKASSLGPFSDVEGDGEVKTGATSPASVPSPTPDAKRAFSLHVDGLPDGNMSVKARLPTPFWPVSLQKQQLETLKSGGGDQPPALPDVFPALPRNVTPGTVADVVRRTSLHYKVSSHRHFLTFCRMCALQTIG